MSNNVNTSGGSPFCYYPGEHLEEVRSTIPTKIRLSELDQLILAVINRCLVVTTLLLHRYLEDAGLKGTTPDDIRGCLRRLADNGYLSRLRFQTPDGQSNLQVFTLAELGREEIRRRGRNTLRLGYLERMDSIHAKRQLAALQFIIGQGYVPLSSQTSYGRLVRDLRDATGSRLFRTQAAVQGKDKTVFVEAVRDCPGATEELKKKLKRIRATLSSDLLNLTGFRNYELVIVAESYQHMKHLMEELDRVLPADFRGRVVFTNDQDTFFRTQRLHRLPERRSFTGTFPAKIAGLFGLQL